MRKCLSFIVWTILITSIPFFGTAQSSLSGLVLDSVSKEPLAYAHVGIPGDAKGTITNGEGMFRLDDVPTNSLVQLSYIGYEMLTLNASDALSRDTFYLQPSSVALEGLVIYADNDILYQEVARCARQMRGVPRFTSRTYYTHETVVNEEPIELLESFFNANVDGNGVVDLKFKNGRAGLPTLGNSYFFNFQNSEVINRLNLIEQSDLFPANPLQMKIGKMKKRFELRALPSLTDTSTLHIAFTPREDDGTKFSGEIWMDRASGTLRKVILTCDNSTVMPFRLWIPESKINQLKIRFEVVFHQRLGTSCMEYIRFDYDLDLDSWILKEMKNWRTDMTSMMHFYDPEAQFFIPIFEYDPAHTDYRKISFVPYDSLFWANAQGYPYTEQQQRKIAAFERDGVLINFTNGRIHIDSSTLTDNTANFAKEVWIKQGLHEQNNVIWSDSSRLSFDKLKSSDAPQISQFQADRYDVAVQIFLDANEYDGQWFVHSATVLDVFNSYNYIGESDLRNCFVNIYFDLCEIERRKMMDALNSGPLNEELIRTTYSTYNAQLEERLKDYKRAVQQGANLEALAEWNDKVYTELGIDNMKLFSITEASN